MTGHSGKIHNYNFPTLQSALQSLALALGTIDRCQVQAYAGLNKRPKRVKTCVLYSICLGLVNLVVMVCVILLVGCFFKNPFMFHLAIQHKGDQVLSKCTTMHNFVLHFYQNKC